MENIISPAFSIINSRGARDRQVRLCWIRATGSANHEITRLFSPRLPLRRERKAGARVEIRLFFSFSWERESVTQRAVHRRNRVTTSALIAVQRKYLFTGCLLRFVSYFFFFFFLSFLCSTNWRIISLIYVRRKRESEEEIKRHLSWISRESLRIRRFRWEWKWMVRRVFSKVSILGINLKKLE